MRCKTTAKWRSIVPRRIMIAKFLLPIHSQEHCIMVLIDWNKRALRDS